jgi:hypothetical protein
MSYLLKGVADKLSLVDRFGSKGEWICTVVTFNLSHWQRNSDPIPQELPVEIPVRILAYLERPPEFSGKTVKVSATEYTTGFLDASLVEIPELKYTIDPNKHSNSEIVGSLVVGGIFFGAGLFMLRWYSSDGTPFPVYVLPIIFTLIGFGTLAMGIYKAGRTSASKNRKRKVAAGGGWDG